MAARIPCGIKKVLSFIHKAVESGSYRSVEISKTCFPANIRRSRCNYVNVLLQQNR